MTRCDIAVIGAGPAGLAAAAECVRAGRTVALIDLNARAGGQYWRHDAGADAPDAPAPAWHHGWATYRALAAEVRAAEASGALNRVAQTHVWSLDGPGAAGVGFTLHLARIAEASGAEGRQRLSTLHARRVIYAPGAYDRQLPVPGWTLPGVMAAGGIQAYVKTEGRAPRRRVVLAGTGPFLLAAADTVLKAGGEVCAVVEAADLRGWFPRGITGALVPSKAVEGARYAAAMLARRVPYLHRRAIVRIEGEGAVQSVVVAKLDAAGRPIAGTETRIEDVDLVGLGWGFTPQAELLVQAGADTRLDVDGSLIGVTDRSLRSSVRGLYLAGEITGAKGAAGAVSDGRIAGRAAAGLRPRRRDIAATLRHRTFARAMHRAHAIPGHWADWLSADTTVCRCEEVTAGQVRDAFSGAAPSDPRTLKGQTRVGMGYCQGRICGFAAQCLSASAADPAARRQAALDVAKRPLATPLELGALAATAPEDFPADAAAGIGV